MPTAAVRHAWRKSCTWGAILLPIALFSPAYIRFIDDEHVIAEGGPLETLQVVLWIAACSCAAAFAFCTASPRERRAAFLLSILAMLAVMRELDLHVLLNPRFFGPLGVRYRIDWWLSPSTPLSLRAGWACIALLCGASLIRLAVRSAGSMFWRRPALLIACAICLFVGFTFDDLLRGRIDLHIAQMVEETAELIGAVLFLFASLMPIIRPVEYELPIHGSSPGLADDRQRDSPHMT